MKLNIDDIKIVGEGSNVLKHTKLINEAYICAIANNVVEIEPNALSCNHELQAVIIPTSVKRIGKCAFDEKEQYSSMLIYYLGTTDEWEKIEIDEQIKEVPCIFCSNGQRVYHI